MSDETFTPLHDLPPGSIGGRGSRDYILTPEELPNVEELVIEDGKPVDNMFVEKQYRLLTEPLYSSWTPPSGSFLALANIGLFYSVLKPPLRPDVMLSLGVRTTRDLMQREHRSYFTWVVGKPPDVVIDLVSDRRGDEDTHKMDEYARIAVTYYAISDPQNRLGGGPLRTFSLCAGEYQPIEASWLARVGLGLTFWEGVYERQQERWLRWCNRDGVVIATGQERAEQEKQRAERLAAQLRAAGIEPEA